MGAYTTPNFHLVGIEGANIEHKGDDLDKNFIKVHLYMQSTSKQVTRNLAGSITKKPPV